MEPEQLNRSVSWSLLLTGVVLTLLGLSPLVTAMAFASGMAEKPEHMQISGMLLSSVFFLGTGLPAVSSFFLRKRAGAQRLAKIAGCILLLFAVAFPFTLALNVPFFIPLFFYLCGAIGIWAILQSR